MYQVNDIGNVTWTGQASPDAPATQRRPVTEQRRPARPTVTLAELQGQADGLVASWTRALSAATTRGEREAAETGLANAKRLQQEAAQVGLSDADATVARLMAAYPPDTPDEELGRDASADAEVDRLMKAYGGPEVRD